MLACSRCKEVVTKCDYCHGNLKINEKIICLDRDDGSHAHICNDCYLHAKKDTNKIKFFIQTSLAGFHKAKVLNSNLTEPAKEKVKENPELSEENPELSEAKIEISNLKETINLFKREKRKQQKKIKETEALLEKIKNLNQKQTNLKYWSDSKRKLIDNGNKNPTEDEINKNSIKCHEDHIKYIENELGKAKSYMSDIDAEISNTQNKLNEKIKALTELKNKK